jgi:hypothetical protein
MINVHRLYPQYQISHDRRISSIPVESERRSGNERRSPDRVQLDRTLTRDLFETKSKVQKQQNSFANLLKNAPFISNNNNSAINTKVGETLNKDTFVSSSKPSASQKNETSKALTAISVLASVFGGVIGTMLFGTVGAVMGIGLVSYVSAKAFKNIVAEHIKDKK